MRVFYLQAGEEGKRLLQQQSPERITGPDLTKALVTMITNKVVKPIL